VCWHSLDASCAVLHPPFRHIGHLTSRKSVWPGPRSALTIVRALPASACLSENRSLETTPRNRVKVFANQAADWCYVPHIAIVFKPPSCTGAKPRRSGADDSEARQSHADDHVEAKQLVLKTIESPLSRHVGQRDIWLQAVSLCYRPACFVSSALLTLWPP